MGDAFADGREIEWREEAGENARGLNKSVPLVVGSDLARGTGREERRRTEGERKRERETFVPRSDEVRNKNIF